MNYMSVRPEGSIATVEQLSSFIEEVKKKNERVPIYSVCQGNMSTYYLTPDSRIFYPEVMPNVPFFTMSYFDGFESECSCGDRNITEDGALNGYNTNVLFTNKELAEAFANKLTADPEYQAHLKEWRRECDDMFKYDYYDGNADEYFDEYTDSPEADN